MHFACACATWLEGILGYDLTASLRCFNLRIIRYFAEIHCRHEFRDAYVLPIRSMQLAQQLATSYLWRADPEQNAGQGKKITKQ